MPKTDVIYFEIYVISAIYSFILRLRFLIIFFCIIMSLRKAIRAMIELNGTIDRISHMRTMRHPSISIIAYCRVFGPTTSLLKCGCYASINPLTSFLRFFHFFYFASIEVERFSCEYI